MPIQLLDLPSDILALLPEHIRNIEDFTSFTSTCRGLRTLSKRTPARTILRLAAASAPTFFQPHPHFLIAATVRSATTPVQHDSTLLPGLISAFRGGIDGLYAHCIAHGSLTLDELRRWYYLRFSTINPLIDAIDKMAGPQWAATPDFWHGGVSEPWTLDTEPNLAAFQIIIYAELFGHSILPFLEPKSERHLPVLNLDTRLEYIKYCIPDDMCDTGYPGFQVLQTGPYVVPKAQREVTQQLPQCQVELRYILYCGRWKRLWKALVMEVGGHFVVYEERDKARAEAEAEAQVEAPSFDLPMEVEMYTTDDEEEEEEEEAEEDRETHEQVVEQNAESSVEGTVGSHAEPPTGEGPDDWKEDLWWNAVLFSGGMDGFRMMMEYNKTNVLSDKDRARLVNIRKQIEALDAADRPGLRRIGTYLRALVSEAPDMVNEVYICMAPYFPGTQRNGGW